MADRQNDSLVSIIAAVMSAMSRFSSDMGFNEQNTKASSGLDRILESAVINVQKHPARSPNLNAHSERFVRSVREECLGRMILVGEGSLRRALDQYWVHYNHERNHQGLENEVLAPREEDRVGARDGAIRKRERLGGMLNFYWREAG